MKHIQLWCLSDVHEKLITTCSSLCHKPYLHSSIFMLRLHQLHKYIEKIVKNEPN